MANSRKHNANLEWLGKMVECVESLPPDERAELDRWDHQRPDGVASSDWPGFDKYLPPRPWNRAEAANGTRSRHVKFAIPDELANSVEELAKRCGVHPVNVVVVGLKMVTDIACDDEGLRHLQERATLLKPAKFN